MVDKVRQIANNFSWAKYPAVQHTNTLESGSEEILQDFSKYVPCKVKNPVES